MARGSAPSTNMLALGGVTFQPIRVQALAQRVAAALVDRRLRSPRPRRRAAGAMIAAICTAWNMP